MGEDDAEGAKMRLLFLLAVLFTVMSDGAFAQLSSDDTNRIFRRSSCENIDWENKEIVSSTGFLPSIPAKDYPGDFNETIATSMNKFYKHNCRDIEFGGSGGEADFLKRAYQNCQGICSSNYSTSTTKRKASDAEFRKSYCNPLCDSYTQHAQGYFSGWVAMASSDDCKFKKNIQRSEQKKSITTK
jgi:hypothetical protein